MAIPVSYTEKTFAEYIKDEVLQDVSSAMDWLIAEEPVWVGLGATFGDSAVNSTYIDFLGVPAETAFFAGTQLKITGDSTIYTVTEVAPKTISAVVYERVRFFPYLKTAVADGATTVSYNSAYPYTTNPAFDSITGETLLALGMDSIDDADSPDEILRLRMMGRVEAWRAVMCNCAAMTSSETQEGNFFNRAQVFFNARDQLILAEQDYGRLYGLSISIQPAYVTSTNTNVRGEW